MQLPDGEAQIRAGEFIIVPRGVAHLPIADDEVLVLLFEPAATRNTGNVKNDRTRPIRKESDPKVIEASMGRSIAAEVIGAELRRFRQHWPRLELTSYEPALLLALQRLCPGLTTDLLIPRSESWVQLDVVAYQAGQRARLAHAHAVHLHPTQLTPAVVAYLREQNLQVHAWDVNAAAGLETIAACGIPRICTDSFNLAWAFRKSHAAEAKATRPISSSNH